MLKLIACEFLVLGGSIGIIVGLAIAYFVFTETLLKKSGRRHYI